MELSDRCEGGKTWWVPVTQKTYWPPPPPSCSTPGSTVRQESSASFSVSDDSSVQSQSSPWQRETRWKNSTPLRALTSEGFILCIKSRERCRYQWTQRRRPFHWLGKCHVKPVGECSQCKVKWKSGTERPSLAIVTSRLLEKALAKKPSLTSTECLVSPRKRLLRDMEKVRLNDRSSSPSWNALKKAKAVLPPTPLPTHSAAAVAAAAAAHCLQPTKVYDRQSSYSIDSLLNKETQEAPSNSSFLRSLLRKNPAGVPNGIALKNKGHSVSQPRLPLHPPDFMPDASHLGIASRAPVWSPYNVGSLSPLVAPSTALLARPGPSSRNESADDGDEAPLNLTVSRSKDS